MKKKNVVPFVTDNTTFFAVSVSFDRSPIHERTIKLILRKMAPAVGFLEKQGYHETERIVYHGVHERVTGYKSFEAKYHSIKGQPLKTAF